MCGRYYMNDEAFREIERVVRHVDRKLRKDRRGDIHPSQTGYVINGKCPGLYLEEMHWGFPQYQKNGLLINARAETVLERKTFRDSVLYRRCVIPAAHFYEWDSGKNKVTFTGRDRKVLYLAGFYNLFQEGEQFVILTTQANPSVSPVHSRMPLILEENELERWVYDREYLENILQKTPPELCREQEYEQQSLFF